MLTAFPSRSDYVTVIKNLDVCAADPSIKRGQVCMRKDGLFPQIYSGGRAVVFPVLIAGNKYAIKCWIQELGALEERYRFVSSLIEKLHPPYLIDSVYRESELLFNGFRYPVLQMQWSESETLKDWITSNINNSSHLSKLAHHFLDVTIDMHDIKMSHGDLQHENILVDSECAITLVDYDSIYLPGLDHLDDEIKGLPGFQHSSRALQLKASAKSDYLSEYAIYTSLIALSKEPSLWEAAKDHNRLLFSQEDLDNPTTSYIFKAIRSIKGLVNIIDAFEAQCLCSDLDQIVPLESIFSSTNSAMPSPTKKTSRSNQQQSKGSDQPKASGRASDLRNAKGWRGRGAQDRQSGWSFDGLINSTTKKVGIEQSCVASASADNVSASHDQLNSGQKDNCKNQDSDVTSPQSAQENNSVGSHKSTSNQSKSSTCPIVNTPNHKIAGSLYGVEISKGLISVSFEEKSLRFICRFGNGNTDSEILISKKKIRDWRRVGPSIEIFIFSIYDGDDLIKVSSPFPTLQGCINQIAIELDSAGIKSSYDSESPKAGLDDSASSFDKASTATPSESPQQPARQYDSPTNARIFSYSSIQDIAYCIGKSSFEVETAAKLLQVKPPFSLGEANRLAEKLVGDSSIRRVYDRLRSSPSYSVPTPSSNETTGSNVVASNSPSKPTTSSSSNDCFVATAIYGTPNHPELSILRAYRDTVLKSSLMGRIFIHCYYKIGPYIATAIERSGLSQKLRPLMSLVVGAISIKK